MSLLCFAGVFRLTFVTCSKCALFDFVWSMIFFLDFKRCQFWDPWWGKFNQDDKSLLLRIFRTTVLLKWRPQTSSDDWSLPTVSLYQHTVACLPKTGCKQACAEVLTHCLSEQINYRMILHAKDVLIQFKLSSGLGLRSWPHKTILLVKTMASTCWKLILGI